MCLYASARARAWTHARINFACVHRCQFHAIHGLGWNMWRFYQLEKYLAFQTHLNKLPIFMCHFLIFYAMYCTTTISGFVALINVKHPNTRTNIDVSAKSCHISSYSMPLHMRNNWEWKEMRFSNWCCWNGQSIKDIYWTTNIVVPCCNTWFSTWTHQSSRAIPKTSSRFRCIDGTNIDSLCNLKGKTQFGSM